ncbi:MAG: hypothetical protein M1819_003645 [Sarea resinae]|nr:MAG: hypothetical protein M1819_003645 [Sarea resinae]
MLATSTISPLRAAAARGCCRLQPAVALRTSYAYAGAAPTAVSTTTTTSAAQPCRKLSHKADSPLSNGGNSSRRVAKRAFFQPSHTPFAFPTASTTRAASTASASPATSASTASPAHLDWNTFLQLRKVRRRYTLAASIATSLGTTLIGVQFLSHQDIEALSGQFFGLDPFVVLGIATAVFGASGWLLGPFFGERLFLTVNKKFKLEIAAKEKEFYKRIKRYRVDPSSQSFSNPVPDYYGEKIGSVKEYRQWLKDQRAYNKKRQRFL